MELSESVMKGLQTLADPTVFDLKSFTIFTEVAFDSLVSPRGGSVLGKMVEGFFPLCCITSGAFQTRRKSRCAVYVADVIF